LQKHLRLSKAEEGDASYKVLRLATTLDLAPNPAAWKAVQRIVAKVNPKIAQVDLDRSSHKLRAQSGSERLSRRAKKKSEVILARASSALTRRRFG
jgi:hypothetical protein